MQVTWLASWTDNIQGQIKYIMLNPTSRLKVHIPGMCPGVGEWWLHKGVLNLRNLISMCLGFLVDTLFCVKWLARLSIFIHANILIVCSGGKW